MRFLFAALLATVVAGCAHTAPFEPAAGATTVNLPGDVIGAFDTDEGVRVTAAGRAWPGSVPISSVVTPIKVRIENNSGKRILLRYSDIKLVSADGRSYAALPPYHIDASVAVPVLAPGYVPIQSPLLLGRRFAVSPLYAPLYPRLPRMPTDFYYDPFYYSHFGNYWRNVELPTVGMLRRALPEGTVSAGGVAEGFVYFEKADRKVRGIRFHMNIVNAENDRQIGSIEIPFAIS